jgi:hypothetical protein
MMDYQKVSTCGFTAYCDALIARKVKPGYRNGTYIYNTEFRAFLMSLIGTASYIKTISAQVSTGEQLTFGDEENTPCYFYCRNQSKIAENTKTVRVRKIGDTVNKIIVQRFLYEDHHQAAVVFGKDLLLVKEPAFRRLDSATTIPLKKQWIDWLWDEVMSPEELFSYGGEDLRFAYLVSWPTEEELKTKILDAIKLNYLN